jgi:hypothetical protein
VIIDIAPRNAKVVAKRRCEVREVASDLVDELKSYLTVAAGRASIDLQ